MPPVNESFLLDANLDILIMAPVNETEISAISYGVYYTPFIVGLGVIGNSLSIYVLVMSRLHKYASSVYLLSLAISDNGYLVLIYMTWLLALGRYDVYRKRGGLCQVFVYLSNLFSGLSFWLVLAFTFERYVVIKNPLIHTANFTKKRAYWITFCLVTASLVFNAPLIFYAEPLEGSGCGVRPEQLPGAQLFNIFDMVVTFTIPMIGIVVLNFLIAKTVHENNKARDRMISVQNPHIQKFQNSIAKTLLVISSIFVALNLPAYLMRLLTYSRGERDEIWIFYQQLATNIFNINFSLNFIFYCWTGQYYRATVYKMFRITRLCELFKCCHRTEEVDYIPPIIILAEYNTNGHQLMPRDDCDLTRLRSKIIYSTPDILKGANKTDNLKQVEEQASEDKSSTPYQEDHVQTSE